MRARTYLVAAACLVAAVAAPASAQSPSPSPSPSPGSAAQPGPRSSIGGDQLSSTGLVIHRGPGTPALPASLLAPGWIVADLDTGAVLAAKDPHGRYRPASTLKTLTSVALLPQEPATATYVGTHAEATIDGTRVGIEPGQTYTRQQILEGMMLISGNDAAEAFAAGYPGGRGAALQAMNSYAAHLQALDTHAVTPSGLDATGQYSSPYDLALVARALLGDPVLSEVVAKRKSTFPCTHGPSCKNHHFEIQNHNHVVTTLPDAIGVKSGGTSMAHIVVVGAIERGGHRLVAVVMKADFDPFSQDIDLLNWAARAESTLTPVGTLVEPLAAPEIVPAQPLSPQQKTATALAKAQSHRASHWRRDVLIVALLVGASVLLVRRRRAPPVAPPPGVRISAPAPRAAPVARSEPYDQDSDPTVRTVSSNVRVRAYVVPGPPSASDPTSETRVQTAAARVQRETSTSHTSRPTTTAKEP